MELKINDGEQAGAFLEFVVCPQCAHQGAYFTASTFTDSEFFDADPDSDVTYTFECASTSCTNEWKES